jgi:hypothetical protein
MNDIGLTWDYQQIFREAFEPGELIVEKRSIKIVQ